MTGEGATPDAAAPVIRRRLIVNADDFGLTPGVTSGILEAHIDGIVTSTSMMVHCPGWDHAVARARQTPTLGIGLHFNLLVGAPITGAASLRIPSGRFPPLATLVRRALTGSLDAAEVAAECEAQLAALAGARIRATHIDSHRHMHALPVVCAAVAGVAARHGLPLRRPIESPQLPRGGGAGRFRMALVASSWRMASRRAPAVRHPDYFAGASLLGDFRFAAALAQLPTALPDGTTEFVVHPGYVDAVLSGVDAYTRPREREREALTSPRLASELRRSGVTLVSFAAL